MNSTEQQDSDPFGAASTSADAEHAFYADPTHQEPQGPPQRRRAGVEAHPPARLSEADGTPGAASRGRA